MEGVAIELLVDGRTITGVELVILDKDGTLTDLYTYWSWFAKERARLICSSLGLGNEHYLGMVGAMGLDMQKKKFKPEGPIGVKKRTDVLAAVKSYLLSQGVQDSASACENAFQEADRNAERHLDELISPLPGAVEFAKKLEGKCKVAVATADLGSRAAMVLARIGISHLDAVVGGEKIQRSKPDPQSVELVLLELGVPPGKAVMVGDSRYDMLCGQNAGLLAGIGVCTGIAEKKELEEVTPYVVKNLSQIGVFD